MNKIYKIEVTPKTILTTILILAVLWLLITLRGVVLLVFIAFSIASMFSPIVEYLNTKKIPRMLSAIGLYLLSMSTLTFLAILIYRPLISQLHKFIVTLPEILINTINIAINKLPFIREQFNWEEILENFKTSLTTGQEWGNISERLVSGVGTAFGIVGSTFNGLINTLSVIILSLHFVQFKEKSKEKLIRKLVPAKHQQRIFNFFNSIEKQLGAWLKTQILLMLIIGLMAFMGFEIVYPSFSIPMGIIAGILECVPGIGPLITWILALIIAIGSGLATWKIIFIFIWFILIQQLENYLIVPKLMEKNVGVSPILTLVAILGGAKILGPLGSLLAVPFIAIIQISLKHYFDYKKETLA